MAWGVWGTIETLTAQLGRAKPGVWVPRTGWASFEGREKSVCCGFGGVERRE